jgi:hypothetical protein
MARDDRDRNHEIRRRMDVKVKAAEISKCKKRLT